MNDNVIDFKTRVLARAQERKQLIHAVDDIVHDMDSILDLIERAHGRGIRKSAEEFWLK